MKSGDRINSTEKNRRGHDAHVVTVAQCKQVLLHNERADTAGLRLYLLQQLAWFNMVLVDSSDDLSDDLVLQCIPTQIAVILVVRKPLPVERQSHSVHLSTHPGEIPFGCGQHRIRRLMRTGAERKRENPGVSRGAGTPGDRMLAVREVILEPGSVALQRRPRRLRRRIVAHTERRPGRNHTPDLLDDAYVPRVFIQGRIDKHRVGLFDVLPRLLKDPGDFLHPREYGGKP